MVIMILLLFLTVIKIRGGILICLFLFTTLTLIIFIVFLKSDENIKCIRTDY